MATTESTQHSPPSWGRSQRGVIACAAGVALALLALLALGGPADARAALRSPVLGKLVNVSPVNGRVLVKLPHRGRFVRLRGARTIPVGSQLHTKRGTVRLTSARRTAAKTQSGRFGGGVFKVLQGRKSDGLTVLRLRGGNFRVCVAGAKSGATASLSRRKIRRLRARARGRFRTRGRYSASTVRGTDFTVVDRCDGTHTAVRSGTVIVRDLVLQRTVLVRAGDSYLTRATATPPPAQSTLTVTKGGTGSGTVTSSPAGIDCGATCSASFVNGTSVTLTATPAAGSSFVSWTGCDAVTANQCTVNMTASRTVTATFNAVPVVRTLTVNKTGTGSGTVTSSPPGINCGPTCSAQFNEFTLVTLTATPAQGSSFVSWTGCDSVSANQCTVSMTASRTVTATFNAAPVFRTLTVNKSGIGTGTVTSQPAGINCGPTCSASFVDGTTVSLTATADSGSFFVSWTGCDSVDGNQCFVSMTANRTVTAAFSMLF